MRGEKLLRAKEELEERSNDRETMNSPKQQGEARNESKKPVRRKTEQLMSALQHCRSDLTRSGVSVYTKRKRLECF